MKIQTKPNDSKIKGGYSTRRIEVVIDDEYDVAEIESAILQLNIRAARARGSSVPNIRMFTVDFDNYDSVNKVWTSLQGRRANLAKEGGILKQSKKMDRAILLDSCHQILSADISFLFDTEKYDAEPKYYVYFHCTTRKPLHLKNGACPAIVAFAASLGLKHSPYYVGKGCGDRAFKKERNNLHRVVSLQEQTREPEVFIYKNKSASSATAGGKNAYEIRLDVLGMAHKMVETKYLTEVAYSQASAGNKLPRAPEPEDVVARATALYEFVSLGSKYK